MKTGIQLVVIKTDDDFFYAHEYHHYFFDGDRYCVIQYDLFGVFGEEFEVVVDNFYNLEDILNQIDIDDKLIDFINNYPFKSRYHQYYYIPIIVSWIWIGEDENSEAIISFERFLEF